MNEILVEINEPFRERCVRVGAVARDLGAAAVLASDVGTVRWLTGRQTEIEFGPPYPTRAGTHVLVDQSGGGAVICPVGEIENGPRLAHLSVEAYEAYTLGPLRPFDNAADVLDRLIGTEALLAVEPVALPVAIARSRRWVDASQRFRALRMVKDAAELRRIGGSASIVSVGQRAFRELAAPGRREIDVFSDVHSAMERSAGVRVPVLPDLMSGPRMLLVGVPPTPRAMNQGELVLCDLAARREGYWADSCTTICLGSPTAEMRRLHDVVARALDAAIDAARPGVEAGQIDALARSILADAGYQYPHHTGHGVGVSNQEEPRIVPGAGTRLEAGMVIALEPAGFGNGIGARIEQVVQIAASGPHILTDYETRLQQ